MPELIPWSRNPEVWAFRAKRLRLKAAINHARSMRFIVEQEHIAREYQRLRERRQQLVEDGQFAKARNDPQTTCRLASQIASFYRDVGIVEGRMDTVLDRWRLSMTGVRRRELP